MIKMCDAKKESRQVFAGFDLKWIYVVKCAKKWNRTLDKHELVPNWRKLVSAFGITLHELPLISTYIHLIETYLESGFIVGI